MSQPDQPVCPQCGAALAAAAPAGLCPRCLMALNLAAPTEAPDETGGPAATGAKPPPPAPAEIARHFPQLEILECLGRGGMGVVYKARQPRLERLVALKVLAPERETDPQFAERFAREARALARLSHPNIVTVHDFGEADGLFYLVMEYVDGASLRQLLQARRLAPEEALAIVPRICEALQFAHDKGIVHRDIKPENILLDREGRVKIADFGIAKLLEAGPAEGSARPTAPASGPPAAPALTGAQVVGTPSYMSPEQAEQPGAVDHRADIYSLGVVFYEMLTGEVPGEDLLPPSRKVRIDVRLDEVVLRALAQEPERRYQHASDFKTHVETIATTLGGPGGQPAPAGDPPREPGATTIPSTSPSGGLAGAVETAPRRWPAVLRASVVITYAVGLVGGVLLSALSLGGASQWMLALFGFTALGAPFLALAILGHRDPVVARGFRAVCGILGLVVGVPLIGFALFFLQALLSETGGWNPAPDEAVIVPLIWLGAVLVPWAGWRLWRDAHPRASVPADASPLALMDFWQALEAGDYARAWEKSAVSLQRDVGRQDWLRRMEERRRPLGKAVSRKPLTQVFLSPGRRFEQSILTTFDTRQAARETVVCALQPDGEWRVERYALGAPGPCPPAPDGAGPAAAPGGWRQLRWVFLAHAVGFLVVGLCGAVLLPRFVEPFVEDGRELAAGVTFLLTLDRVFHDYWLAWLAALLLLDGIALLPPRRPGGSWERRRWSAAVLNPLLVGVAIFGLGLRDSLQPQAASPVAGADTLAPSGMTEGRVASSLDPDPAVARLAFPLSRGLTVEEVAVLASAITGHFGSEGFQGRYAARFGGPPVLAPSFAQDKAEDGSFRLLCCEVRVSPFRSREDTAAVGRFLRDELPRPLLPAGLRAVLTEDKPRLLSAPGPAGIVLTAEAWLAETPAEFKPTAGNMDRQRLAQTRGVSLLSTPRVVTGSGQEAVLAVQARHPAAARDRRPRAVARKRCSRCRSAPPPRPRRPRPDWSLPPTA